MRRPSERLAYLREDDLDFLVQTVATRRTDHAAVKEIIRDKPDLIDIMLDDPHLMTAIREKQEVLLQISPYLFFTILLRQVKRDLQKHAFTLELLDSAEEIPVFDSPQVAGLLEKEALLEYLADLLVSFTRTYSSVFFYKVGSHWERRRFSDMDVDDLLSLSRLVEDENRFPIYKRLGDLSLFLIGVFPEAVVHRPELHTSRHSHPLRLEDYLEMGPQFYQKAAVYPEAQQIRMQEALQLLSDNFALARKPLNILAQRYMGFHRYHYFDLPEVQGDTPDRSPKNA